MFNTQQSNSLNYIIFLISCSATDLAGLVRNGFSDIQLLSIPASEGEGGSLSSRSSAEDMVPLDGVRGSFRWKSPKRKL